MVTINNTNPPQQPVQVTQSSNTGLIVLALVILAALVIGAVYFMNGGELSTTSTSNTVDRTITRVEQVPAQVGNAVDNAANNNPANTTPPANAEPAPTPAQ